jgi:hypothetical protein
MEIQIDSHTRKRAAERGTNEEEIHDVLASGFFIPAKYNRLGKAKIYLFRKERHRTYYEQKRVEVYYLVENNRIVVVTVYVFYGQWENEDERTL